MDRLEGWEIDALESLVRQYEWSAHDYYSKAYDIEMDSDDAKILEKAIELIKAIPSAEPKTVKSCDTCKHDEAFGCPSFIYDRCKNYSEWEQADKSKGKALEQEPCEDTISREALKHKLQEHHDFFVNAYGGFSNLPQNDKARVDEITNCIAMVVNEPSVKPQEKTGHWIIIDDCEKFIAKCSECGQIEDSRMVGKYAYCHCGAKMD